MIEHQDAIVKARHAAAIQSLLPYMEMEIGSMQQTALTRAFQALRKGTLTPEDAYHTIAELNSYQTLLARFGSKVKAGQTAGAKIAPIMEIEGDDNG